jgi:hypothetical protein
MINVLLCQVVLIGISTLVPISYLLYRWVLSPIDISVFPDRLVLF